MNKFGKIFFWFLGIVVLLFWGISWGQTTPECTTDQQCIDKMWANGKCMDWICTNISEVTVTDENCNWWKVIAWICKCPTWTTLVKGEWCVSCDTPWVCCGVKLNTKIPFIGDCIELDSKAWDSCKENSDCGEWGTCIHRKDEQWNFSEEWTCQYDNDSDETKVTDKTAFPLLMWGLTKMMVTVILLMSFILILVGWVMISASWSDDGQAREGKKLIGKVLIGIALLGASGVILRLINPHFFG